MEKLEQAGIVLAGTSLALVSGTAQETTAQVAKGFEQAVRVLQAAPGALSQDEKDFILAALHKAISEVEQF